jgi:hypothetical protein
MESAVREREAAGLASHVNVPAEDGDLFMQGPPMLAEARLGLLRPGRMHTGRRCLVFVLLTWLPLCLLTALEGTLLPRADGISLLTDLGAFARSWVAGPLLLLADLVAGRELSRIATRFEWMCSFSPTARARFAGIVASTRRLRDGLLLELLVAATVATLVIATVNGLSLQDLPLWHHSPADPGKLSTAGWWYALVSLPLLLLLVVGWLWRLVLWTRFLVLVAKLDLAIVPEHPDRAGGMGFVGYSVRGFATVAAAFGAVVAGAVGNQVMHNGVPFTSMRFVIAGTAAACVVLFCAPLCVFASRLAAERRRGLRHFGELATSFGLQFGREWFTATSRVERDTLERGDFSAATDLYQVVDRVQAMRFVPLDRVNVTMVAVATLVPFLPVALMAVPFETVVARLLALLV